MPKGVPGPGTKLCTAKNKAGMPCKMSRQLNGSLFCYMHDNKTAATRKAAAKASQPARLKAWRRTMEARNNGEIASDASFSKRPSRALRSRDPGGDLMRALSEIIDQIIRERLRTVMVAEFMRDTVTEDHK